MKTFHLTDVGLKREQNEDNVFSAVINDENAFAVVCDGMGGAHGGEIASGIACKEISRKIKQCYRPSMSISSIQNMLLSVITTANVIVYDTAVADSNLEGMGTTVVCAFVSGSQLCIAHAGDSRAYVISGEKIRQLTKDHSLVQQMFDSGEISKEQMENHPVKNYITRALGVDENIEVDFTTDSLSENDMVLICSDGLTNFVNADEIYQITNNNEPENVPKLLIDKANENGGGDNISVAIITR